MNKLWSAAIWRLVRAEMSYNLFVHAILFLTLTFSFHAFASLEARGVNNPALQGILAVAIMYLLYTTRFAEKRTRFIQILPISQSESALVRLYSQALYWIGALLIYAVSLLAYFPKDMLGEVLWRLFALNALLLTANAAFCLSFDLWETASMPMFIKALFIGLLWMLAFGMSALHVEGSFVAIMPKANTAVMLFLYKTPIGMLLQHLVAVGLSIMSYQFFLRREALT